MLLHYLTVLEACLNSNGSCLGEAAGNDMASGFDVAWHLFMDCTVAVVIIIGMTACQWVASKACDVAGVHANGITASEAACQYAMFSHSC